MPKNIPVSLDETISYHSHTKHPQKLPAMVIGIRLAKHFGNTLERILVVSTAIYVLDVIEDSASTFSQN